MIKNEIIIKNIVSGSIAEEAGVEKGDILLSINDNSIEDIIEYKFLTTEEYLTLIIKKKSGEEWEIEIEKDFSEDIGIEFDDPSMLNPKRCHNKCIFCFIDQLPPGMRESLYFKDDDSRLSFVHGNFVTLTNMKNEDIDRIIKYRISPINVSIHTTNPELRVKILNNKNAGNIMHLLNRLSEGGISINCQIVLCPGINDGIELERTIMELYELFPSIAGVAIVPVGITRFREELFKLEGYNKENSMELIKKIQPLQKKMISDIGEPFFRLADEFYVMAEMEVPELAHYGDFEQLEDGIGMIRYFESCVEEALNDINIDGKGKSIAVITGKSASKYLINALDEVEKKLNIKFSVYPIENNFFGEKITVAGLITAGDIISQLKGKINEDFIIIPSNMLKADKDVFLDDITLEELEETMGKRIVKCKYSGDDFMERILKEVI